MKLLELQRADISPLGERLSECIGGFLFNEISYFQQSPFCVNISETLWHCEPDRGCLSDA